MKKTILITGATDGIGLATAKQLAALGHDLLIHGRNPEKLAATQQVLKDLTNAHISVYQADLSRLAEVQSLADQIKAEHHQLDVLINNAGIFRTSDSRTGDGLDVRFAVNTIAPYLLTQQLLPLLKETSRVINLSSAAQSNVDLDALQGKVTIENDFNAYAQSKLAITMWSRLMPKQQTNAPLVIAVNPGSMLGTNMVKDGFGVEGGDIKIGSDILCKLALDAEFNNASGLYFDNDKGQLSQPHADALDDHKCIEVVEAIQAILAQHNL